MIDIGTVTVKHETIVQDRKLAATATNTDHFNVRLAINGNELFSLPAEDLNNFIMLLEAVRQDISKTKEFLKGFPCAVGESN